MIKVHTIMSFGKNILVMKNITITMTIIMTMIMTMTITMTIFTTMMKSKHKKVYQTKKVTLTQLAQDVVAEIIE